MGVTPPPEYSKYKYFFKHHFLKEHKSKDGKQERRKPLCLGKIFYP
jgi:hypothetical protein